jgi:CRISPR/Cas system CMR-associated protein Cmr5 small subunit
MKTWMADMSDTEDKMRKALQDIYENADIEMGNHNSASILMTLRWIKKLAKRGLGESDD